MQTTQDRGTSTSIHKKPTPESDLLVIQRTFNVPVEDLYLTFTTPEDIQAWWWPQGLFADKLEYDFREGGHYFIRWKSDDGKFGGMSGEFEEIVNNKRIVMAGGFADENGRAISAQQAGMSGVWPETGYITFEFNADRDGVSRVTLSQQGVPNEGQKDCKKGWSQMFDKLEKYLGSSQVS
jgi:uncharacterized protein YndB with AHSA1/START domain